MLSKERWIAAIISSDVCFNLTTGLAKRYPASKYPVLIKKS